MYFRLNTIKIWIFRLKRDEKNNHSIFVEGHKLLKFWECFLGNYTKNFFKLFFGNTLYQTTIWLYTRLLEHRFSNTSRCNYLLEVHHKHDVLLSISSCTTTDTHTQWEFGDCWHRLMFTVPVAQFYGGLLAVSHWFIALSTTVGCQCARLIETNAPAHSSNYSPHLLHQNRLNYLAANKRLSRNQCWWRRLQKRSAPQSISPQLLTRFLLLIVTSLNERILL